jgi:hypothetical protein
MKSALDYYGKEMESRRKKFNTIINGINMVLINNIAEVDPTVWENWEAKSPFSTCLFDNDRCDYHGEELNEEGECDYQDEADEVYQWFAVSDNDADYLKRHNQYITYSGLLDTYFLAICHFGTSWDYVDSMVNDTLGDK